MRFKEAYGGWQEDRLTQEEAALILGVSDRSFRRYIDRYEESGLEGLADKRLGEPSQATLEKLAAYFGVSVAWLRGGDVGPLERLLGGLKIGGIDPDTYNKTVAEKMGKECDY